MIIEIKFYFFYYILNAKKSNSNFQNLQLKRLLQGEELNEKRRIFQEKADGACALSSPTASMASSTSPLLESDMMLVSVTKFSDGSDKATVGLCSGNKEEEDITDSVEDLCGYTENQANVFQNETLSFHTINCSRCFAPATSIMKVTSKFLNLWFTLRLEAL